MGDLGEVEGRAVLNANSQERSEAARRRQPHHLAEERRRFQRVARMDNGVVERDRHCTSVPSAIATVAARLPVAGSLSATLPGPGREWEVVGDGVGGVVELGHRRGRRPGEVVVEYPPEFTVV